MIRRAVTDLAVLLMLLSTAMLVAPPGFAAVATAPSLSGPALAPLSSTVTITGHAAAGEPVQIWFHRQGDPAALYTLRRHLTADATGTFRTTYLANTDYRYYAVAAGQRSRVVLTQATKVSISGPGSARWGSTVRITGTALPTNAAVSVYFHRAGEPPSVYTLRRQLRSDAAGKWSTSYLATADERYYATSNGLTSAFLLTQAVVAKPVYVFPVSPAGAVSYAHVHHDYPATDVFAPCQSNLVAVTDGVVQEVSRVDRWNPATDDPAVRGGLTISLIGDDGVRYYTAHLHDILPGIAPGVRVRHGQLMAHVGETGNARGLGCHVHVGMSPPCGPGEWSIRRGVFYPWPFLDSWRSGGQASPVGQMKAWLAGHQAECATHHLAGA